ncbi:hypothetical protein [Gluconobacter oxydans]|uniref:hypothetical protein n=1 Tax=Gluconobacter oxydans TaxID=442 RepID=UPI001CD8BEDD|nr:hypothetical protein [Gluconobacter oxydans]
MRRLSYLALSAALIVAPALAVPTSPSDHGLFDGGAFPPEASGFVTHVDLASYVTQVSLTAALSASLTLAPLYSGTVLSSGLRASWWSVEKACTD